MLVQAEGLGHLGRRALAQDPERGVELALLELPADELAERAGGPARGERGLRERRREALEMALDLVAGGGEGPLAGRIVAEEPLGEPHGADVEGARPCGAALGGADDRLGRAAAHVADGDAARQGASQRGDRAERTRAGPPRPR